MSQLVDDHRAALDALVVAGELDAKVANQVQSAFSAAAFHVWRSNVPVTCYEPVLVDFKPISSGQLVQQADLLAEMAETNSLDRDTVARAQAAIERDIAFLALSYADAQALYEGLIKAAEGVHSIPAFDDVDLQMTPEAVEAARFLAELLLGAQGQ
jgi:hypothetical protein